MIVCFFIVFVRRAYRVTSQQSRLLQQNDSVITEKRNFLLAPTGPTELGDRIGCKCRYTCTDGDGKYLYISKIE
jgi:hypothetical protein